MGLVIRGYAMEPPRVGQSNSPYTFTPNAVISDQGAFDAAYPSNEANPRTEYHVFVLRDGDLHDATFCWTKNEELARFDYDGAGQRFRTLPGAPLIEVGALSSSANTTRLVASPPALSDLSAYPVRLSVGVGSGTEFAVTIVPTSASFGIVSTLNVEIAQNTGELNWNVGDLTTYAGQAVRFQRQSFYSFKESSGNIGLVSNSLLLNPKPTTTQSPLIRLGYGSYLTPVQRANEGLFSSNPTAGTVEWALDTGRLKFNATDISTYTGKPVFYDGVVFGFGISVPVSSHGTVGSPSNITPIPSEDSDAYFRVPGVVQFQNTVYVDSVSTYGKQGTVEILRSTGGPAFSIFDRAAYGTLPVQLVLPDLPIERGMAVRWFRTPVDLTATDVTLKDVSSLYPTSNAVLANPIIAAPQILLPTLPVESLPITVKVEQGTGTFVGVLPNLDVPSPLAGYGYIIDFSKQQLSFAQRRVNVVIPGSARKPYGSVQLPDPLVFTPSLTLELETGPSTGVYAPLTLGVDVLMDYAAGVAKLVTQTGTILATGSASASGSVLTDPTANFLSVVAGDLVVVESGPAVGVYTVVSSGATSLTVDLSMGTVPSLQYTVRRGKEVLVDRYFQDVPPIDPNTRIEKVNLLGNASNSPRLSIPADRISAARGRLGKTSFVTLTVVSNDGSFTAPGSLAAGVVEVSQATGHLNFAASDLGTPFYWARTLVLGTDFRLQTPLGYIEFTERLLEREEVQVTYAVVNDSDVKEVVTERGTFLVRKELTQSHPTPTNTLSFNPLGREIASVPSPSAFRGGRPQKTGTQVTFDFTNSTVQFLPSSQVTDALPSGEVVGPGERVYVDYYVYEALGGEKNLTVLRPPMLNVPVIIEEGTTSFQIAGNRISDFPSGYLLRVDSSEVYLLGAPTYDGTLDVTTVHLASPQTFLSDLNNPALAVTSGQIRVNTVSQYPSYFVTEMAVFESVPRGGNRLRLVGDLSRVYSSGTVLLWTDGGSVLDFNLVDGSTYDATTGRTEVVLKANGRRQYTSGAISLRRSVRSILPSSSGTVTTAHTPDLQLPYQAFRRVEGATGQVLVQPDDFKIDESGRLTLTTNLKPNEEVSLFYTGSVVVEDGRNFRASYTHLVVPSDSNGILNQILRVDYTAYSPDTAYWRVETLTNFRGELVTKYTKDSQSSIPTGGPRLENASTPKLFEQGRESVFYGEGRYTNEDLVARLTLKFLHDGINYLEDALQNMDGRVVGDHDGRFRFDGNINNPVRTSYATVTNDIDDLLKVSAGPAVISFPPFSVSFAGTYREAYKPSQYSRFFPQSRQAYNVTAGPSGLENGDTILDTGFKPLSTVGLISRRLPWAVVTKFARAGSHTIQVDTADGLLDLLRPPFDTAYDMFVSIQARDGTVLVPDAFPLQLSSKTSTSLTFLNPIISDIPAGSTVRHVFAYAGAPPATPYLKNYRAGLDVGVTLSDGVLTNIKPFPPLDGLTPGIPAALTIQNPGAGEVLDVAVQMSSSVTEPDRFPALDGSTKDDDGNRQFPIVSPTPISEYGATVGYMAQELATIQVGGTLRTLTTAPFVGTGDLDVTRAVITNTGGNWPSPVPKVGDLVEIRSGLNNNSGYRRIASVGASTITVAGGQEFTSQDTGFTFTVTVSNSLVVSAFGAVSPTNTLTDLVADFVAAGVQPGHTVVFSTGPNTGLRRQVTQVTGTHTLLIDAATLDASVTYRIDNALGTFGGTNSVYDTVLVPSVNGEVAVLSTNVPPQPWNEKDALDNFLTHFFTDIVTGTAGSVVGTNTFTDVTADFSSVVPGDFVFIRTGSAAGAYKVLNVNSITQVLVESTFPVTLSGISYRIVKVDFLTSKSMNDVLKVLFDVEATIPGVTAFQTLLTTAVTVSGDASARGRRLLISDLDARVTAINTRVTQLTDPATGALVLLSNVLASGDQLYDKRYTWIDARVNLEKGILPLRERSISDRKKAKREIIKQLTKVRSIRL